MPASGANILEATLEILKNDNNHSLDEEQKQKLANFLRKALEAEDDQTLEEVIGVLKNRIISELKAELTDQVKAELKADQTIIDQVKNGLGNEIKQKVNKFEQLEADLHAKNADIEKLKKDLEAKNTEVQQLQQKNKELEAKKQPTEQSKAPTYTAAVGVGLTAGLVAFIALERTVRLDIWVTVGIALASALAASGATYLVLKPSTQVNKAETQEVNNNALEK